MSATNIDEAINQMEEAVKKKGHLFQGKGLSIVQPWATAIAFGGKDVENRTWQTHYRGPVAIHAGAKFCEEDLKRRVRQVRGGLSKPVIEWITMGQKRYKFDSDEKPIILSHIVAIAMLTDCTKRRKSTWHSTDPDSWGWVLQGVVPIKPIPKKGTLGLWDCRFHYEPLTLR